MDSCAALAGYAQLQSQPPILGFLKDVNQRSSELLTSHRLDQSIAKGGCNNTIRLEECWPLETQLVQIFAFKLWLCRCQERPGRDNGHDPVYQPVLDEPPSMLILAQMKMLENIAPNAPKPIKPQI